MISKHTIESFPNDKENLNSKFDNEFYNGGVYQDDSYYDIKNLLIEDLYHYSKKDKNKVLTQTKILVFKFNFY